MEAFGLHFYGIFGLTLNDPINPGINIQSFRNCGLLDCNNIKFMRIC